MGCEDGRISEVLISGTFVGESNVTIRSGVLHAEESFAVRVGEGASQELSWRTAVVDSATTFVGDAVGFAEDFGFRRDFERACALVPQETAEALALLDMRLFNI